MTELMERRRALMGKQKTDDGNLVADPFTPVTQSWSNSTRIVVPLTETIEKGKKYRVILNGTVPEGNRFLVLLGASNNHIEYFPEGQDGEIERTWTTATSGSATTANAYIYCRPVSGTATITATVRNIKVYREGW